jgi:hypothetical protein
LPRGNQAEVAAAVREHGLTSRQTAEVVRRVEQAPSSESARELLEDPMRFLDSPPVGGAHEADARLSEPGDKLRRSLAALERQASITDRVLRSCSAGQLRSSDLDALRTRVHELTETLRALLSALAELVEADVADA